MGIVESDLCILSTYFSYFGKTELYRKKCTNSKINSRSQDAISGISDKNNVLLNYKLTVLYEKNPLSITVGEIM